MQTGRFVIFLQFHKCGFFLIGCQVLHDVFQQFNRIITVEDGVITGGFGSAVIEFMADNNYKADVKRLGIPDKFIEHGTVEQLRKDCGFDVQGIYNTVKEMIKTELLKDVSISRKAY